MNPVRLFTTATAVVLTFSSFLAHAGQPDERLLVDGDVRITAEMYRHEVGRLPPEVQARLRNDPELARREIVDELYRRIRLAQEAERRGLAADPAVRYRMRAMRENVLVQALMVDLREEIEIPDLTRAARERYEARQEEYREPEAVKVRHILLRPADGGAVDGRRAEAESLLERLREGADFADLARQHSGDGSAADGGDLGWIQPGQTVPPFERAAFALQEPGELSGIVQSRFGLHIIQLEERRPARIQEFDEVKERIIEVLRNDFVRKEMEARLRRLASFEDAIVDQDLIDEVVRE